MAGIRERKKTIRKKKERNLPKSEEKFRTILDNIEEGYFEDDLAGNFTFVNNTVCKHLGYSKEELIGMNYTHYTDEKTAKKLRKFYAKVFNTGKSIRTFDLEAIRKDNTRAIYESSVSLIKDSKGKPIGYRGITRDVTKQKQTEEKLHQSEEKYRTLLDNASDAIFLANEEGNLLEVNKKAEELLGYTREELLEVNISKIHPQEELEKNISGFRDIHTKGWGTVNNTAVLRKDGKKVSIDITANVIEYSGKKVLQGIFRNITERKKMEDALRKSEERYRNILESIQEGYFEVDLEGNYTFSNEANCRYLGYAKEELIGMSYQRHTDEETAKKLYQSYHELYQTGEPINRLEVESIRKDGTKTIYETSVSLVKNSKGTPVGFRGVSRDITERKNMEDALRQSEEKYRTILEDMEEGYFEIDLAGNFTFVNDAECRNLGYTREELIGMNNRQYQDETTVKKTYQTFNRLYKTGEPVRVLNVEVIRKDGTKAFNETSISLIRGGKGKPIGFRGVSRNVTERKKMEEELRKSEERYRTILEDIEEGYFELDLAGNATFFNDSICSIFGYPREELLGMNYKQYTDEENGEKCFQIYSNIYRTGEPGNIHEYEIIRKDGAKRYIESSVSLQKDASDKPIRFRGILRDITERKRAEEALNKKQEELIKKNKEIEESRHNVQLTLEKLGAAYEELKTSQAKILQQEKMASIGQLAAGVAHEINNPMAFIASNLGTLAKYSRRLIDFIETQSDVIKSLRDARAIEKLDKKRQELKLDYIIDDVRKLVEESLDGSERVQKIVQGLNRFSRVSDVEYNDAGINECIEGSINIVWNELKYKATLDKDYGNLPSTRCYPQQLSQVFINLLLNAAQSIEEKGKIKIKTWEKDRSIWIAISDTGCGIPKGDQNKIFEPFFTTKEVGKGTGLGLNISYEIIQRHKGEISFKSEKKKGTTFTIRIPVV